MINQQFTFAVHIVTALAFSNGQMSSQQLAASVNTNAVVVRRLLAALRRASLVETFTGKHGGVRLRKAPARISLLEIYDAVECPRPIAINRRKAVKHCPVSCGMHQIMARVADEAEVAVKKRLRRITLDRLLKELG